VSPASDHADQDSPGAQAGGPGGQGPVDLRVRVSEALKDYLGGRTLSVAVESVLNAIDPPLERSRWKSMHQLATGMLQLLEAETRGARSFDPIAAAEGRRALEARWRGQGPIAPVDRTDFDEAEDIDTLLKVDARIAEVVPDVAESDLERAFRQEDDDPADELESTD